MESEIIKEVPEVLDLKAYHGTKDGSKVSFDLNEEEIIDSVDEGCIT